MTPLSLSEQLCFCTTRIESSNDQGQLCSGTGFFYNLSLDSSRTVPLLITNKHVVSPGFNKCRFLFTEADYEDNPIVTKHFPLIIDDDLSKRFIPHPNPDIDLCALPLLPIYKACDKINKKLFFRPLYNSLMPSPHDIEQFDAIEDIIMIGYPNGLWDSVNNMPIIRHGATATHIKYDYNGRPEFVIDAACFPGSSGSPVFILRKGGFTDKMGNVSFGGSRVFFLGVLYAGPQMQVNGDIHIISSPTAQKPMAISKIPNNLGFIIKSNKILDFIPLFNAR